MKLPTSQWTGYYFTVIASVHVLWQFFLLFCPMSSPLYCYCMPVLSKWFSVFCNGVCSHTRSIRGSGSQVRSAACTVHNDMEYHVVYLGQLFFWSININAELVWGLRFINACGNSNEIKYNFVNSWQTATRYNKKCKTLDVKHGIRWTCRYRP